MGPAGTPLGTTNSSAKIKEGRRCWPCIRQQLVMP